MNKHEWKCPHCGKAEDHSHNDEPIFIDIIVGIILLIVIGLILWFGFLI